MTKISLLLLLILSSISCAQTPLQVTSPDGRSQLTVEINKGRPHYQIMRDNRTLLNESKLGIQLNHTETNYSYTGKTTSSFDQTWKPVWAKRSEVRNHYNELTLALMTSHPQLSRMNILFRAYNDGIAFRYILPEQKTDLKEIEISSDLTEFNFEENAQAWFYNGERENLVEQLTQSEGTRRLPMTVKATPNTWIAILEAAIDNFSWMELSAQKDKTTFTSKIYPSTVPIPFATPWRLIMLADQPGDLVDSDILQNLNPPCQIKDTSWIKPGVAFWDWRAWGHQTDGFTYDLNIDSWKRFVDLAAQAGIPYLLIDANWYGPEFEQQSDPTTSTKDVPGLIRYAQTKNVGVFLYLNDVGATKYGLERVLKQFADWGAVGIKYGFMKKKPGQQKVNWTQKVIQECARHKLMCDFHDDPIPPSGTERTWPNALTREYCHAQADAKRSFTPTTFTTAVFVNMLAGPIDMTNGMFDLDHCTAQRPRVFKEIPSTIIAEAARTLIVYSGLTVIPDSADAYKQHPELFDFIASQKMPWTQSKTLAGKIGQYIVTMRQAGDTYLIAAANNEQKRSLMLPLDFLPKNTPYHAVFYEDAPDADYLNHRLAYQIRKEAVHAGSIINITMAPGGGHAIKLTPANP